MNGAHLFVCASARVQDENYYDYWQYRQSWVCRVRTAEKRLRFRRVPLIFATVMGGMLWVRGYTVSMTKVYYYEFFSTGNGFNTNIIIQFLIKTVLLLNNNFFIDLFVKIQKYNIKKSIVLINFAFASEQSIFPSDHKI